MLPISSAGSPSQQEFSENISQETKPVESSHALCHRVAERIDSILRRAHILANVFDPKVYLPLVEGRFCVEIIPYANNKFCQLQHISPTKECIFLQKGYQYTITDVVNEKNFELDFRVSHLLRDHHVIDMCGVRVEDIDKFFQSNTRPSDLDVCIEIVYSVPLLEDLFFHLPLYPSWISPGSIPFYEMKDCIPIDKQVLAKQGITVQQIADRLNSIIGKAEKLLQGKTNKKEEVPLIEGCYFVQKSDQCNDPRLPGTSFFQYCVTDVTTRRQFIFASFIPEMILKHSLSGVGEYRIDITNTINFFNLKEVEKNEKCTSEWVLVDDDMEMPSKEDLAYAEFVKSKKITVKKGIIAYLIEGSMATTMPFLMRNPEENLFRKIKNENQYLYLSVDESHWLDGEEEPIEIFDVPLKQLAINGTSLFKASKNISNKLTIGDHLIKVKKAILSNQGSLLKIGRE